MFCGPNEQATSAIRIAACAPSPSGVGVDSCPASLDSPPPAKHTAAGDRSSSTNPAASPIEIPLRAASKGRQMSCANNCNESKPCRVDRQRLSTPPTTAASIRPASIQRCALRNTLALDEQAVEITAMGPCK